MHKIRGAGIVWLFAIQFFITQIIVQSRWTTPYSLATNYVSDLGNTACGTYRQDPDMYVCSPWHALMNLSFSTQGVIVVAGALLLAGSLRSGPVKVLMLTLLMLTAVGMLGVGLFPENSNNQAHVYFAGVQFVTSNAAMVIAGRTGIIPGSRRIYSLASIILGCLGLAATCLFPMGIHLGLGIGGMERVAAYTFPVWLVMTGLLLLKVGRQAHTALQN